MENKEETFIYGLNDKPGIVMQFLLGLQHVFAAFGGIIVVPIIVSSALGFDALTSTALISGSILAAGIATMIQSRGVGPVGAKLPAVMGTDVTFAAPAIAVGEKFGLPGIMGAILVGGVVESILSIFTKPLIKFFPKVVTGVVICLIGLTLLANAVNWLGGGPAAIEAGTFGNIRYVSVGLIVLLVTMILNHYGKGLLKSASILIGMVFGYLICIPLGMVDFTPVTEASFFAFPRILATGVTFHWEAVLAFLPAFLVGVVGTVGRIKAIENVVEIEEDDKNVGKAILADGVTTVLSGAVGGLTNTTFAQNIGLLSITRVTSRYVTIMAGIILTVLGFFPKFAALIHTIPQPVLGGVSVMMFGMIAVAGIQILSTVKFDNRNMMIVAISLGFGLGVAFRPEILLQFPEVVRMIFSSGITAGTLIAIFLNVVLREPKKPVEG